MAFVRAWIPPSHSCHGLHSLLSRAPSIRLPRQALDKRPRHTSSQPHGGEHLVSNIGGDHIVQIVQRDHETRERLADVGLLAIDIDQTLRDDPEVLEKLHDAHKAGVDEANIDEHESQLGRRPDGPVAVCAVILKADKEPLLGAEHLETE